MVPTGRSVATVAWCSSKCSTRFGAPGCGKLTSVASVADSAYFMKHAETDLTLDEANALYNADALQPGAPALLCEGVFDALAVQQAASDLVATVAAGTTSGARRIPWIARLATASLVLVAMDADAGGEEAASYWLDILQHNGRRWRPLFDDPAAMLQVGLDVRQWVEAGLNLDELERSRMAIT
jgi:hypothetical protein